MSLRIGFRTKVFNNSLIPASAGDIFSENHKGIVEHFKDDQGSIFFAELLGLPDLLRSHEIHPFIEAVLSLSLQLLQEVQTLLTAVAQLDLKRVVAHGKSYAGEAHQENDLKNTPVDHDENRSSAA